MNRTLSSAAALAALLTLTACGSGGGSGGGTPAPSPTPAPAATPTPAPAPAPAPVGITVNRYDGVTDDLLTAGLGWDGLQGAAPSVSSTPTAAELRRLAIYANYRALVDVSPGGGYGRLYGPNVAPGGTVNAAAGAGKIAGSEHIKQVQGPGAGFAATTLMVQIPSSFNPSAACIVTGTAPMSRGIYGAIGAAGEWGLKHGCAVAYTDKGGGNGVHELATNTVTLMNGTTGSAAVAGTASQFTANLSDAERTAYLQNNPFRYAFKHAHSQQNPETDWGYHTLLALQFAFERLSAEYPSTTFNASNTLVIADSTDTGGGAALAAAEQDTGGLIDGIVVTEPEVNLNMTPGAVAVQRGATVYPATAVGRPLYDYMSLANLLQPCAAFAATASNSPLLALIPSQNAQNRCAQLASAQYISGTDFQSQANSALDRLHAAGWEPESDLLHASYWGSQATSGIAVTYANAYARAKVTDNLCGFSFATTSGTLDPGAPSSSPMSTIFAIGNGVPPTGNPNIAIIYNNAQGGPVTHNAANGDFAFAGANCLRQLWTGQTPAALAVQQGVNEVRLTGNLHGKPAIILHGRSDALVPVNHTSRPYFGLNKEIDPASKLSYIEVLNAQHFDAFLSLGGYNTSFVPLHYYAQQALDMMWDFLHNNAALPPSQVVRATPRAAGPADLNTSNVPRISLTPPAGDTITFDAATRTVKIPN